MGSQTMPSMDTVKTDREKALWDRVPVKLRDEYRAAWRVYGQTPSPATYEIARKLEDKLQAAVKALAAKDKRAKQRKAQHA